MIRPFDLRNPSFVWRAFFVAAVFAAPGAMMGSMVALLLGGPATAAGLGAGLAAILGVALEAWKEPVGGNPSKQRPQHLTK